jgi:hypothetical protein
MMRVTIVYRVASDPSWRSSRSMPAVGDPAKFHARLAKYEAEVRAPGFDDDGPVVDVAVLMGADRYPIDHFAPKEAP